MRVWFIYLLALAVILQSCTAPPVSKNKTPEDAKENEIDDKETGLEDYMEYHRYLKEVVDALESDPEFKKKLETAEETDIRSGKIAHELEYVNHKVRTKLDEIKRTELERLRHLANKQYELENGLNFSHEKVGIGSTANKEHLDHFNPHTFEIEDLKKLIAKSTQDLAEADRKRREDFKEYEMQKEFEKREKLKSLDEAHRIELEKELKKREELHKKHEPLHHPGSKQQLEEVWEKQDHMDQQDFNPKTFFMLHDLDGNGAWDQNEVKTLFIKELDKMYQAGVPEDDLRERVEEMERMREHVFDEVDQNKDGLISFNEFIDQTKKQEFQEDKGWDTLENQKVYTDDEYKQFEKQRLEEVQRLIAQGMLPPHSSDPLYHDPRLAQYDQFPSQVYHPGQVPYHPGQQPVHSGQQQMHPGQPQMHPGQSQMHPGQPQMHPGQPQMHPGQPQMHPTQNQVYSGQAQMHPGQPQMHPSQQQMHQEQQKMHQEQQQMHQAQQQMHQGQQQSQYHNQVPQGQAQVNSGHNSQQANFHPGQISQAQVHPQQLPNAQVPPKAPVVPKVADPQLNTNEIYPDNKPNPDQVHQPAHAQQGHQQVQPNLQQQSNNQNQQGPPQVNQV